MAVRLAFSLWGTSLLLLSLGLALPRLTGGATQGVMYDVWREAALDGVIFATVGMLVATRRPDHRIGWLMTAIGLCHAIQLTAGQYAVLSLAQGVGESSLILALAWISNGTQLLAVNGMILLMLLFPSGYVPSRQWQWVLWVFILQVILSLLSLAITSGPGGIATTQSLLGMAVAPQVADILNMISGTLVIISLVGALAALVVRFWRAAGSERQQLKWFVYAAVVGIATMTVLSILVPTVMQGMVGNLMWAAVPSGIAISVAIAILRYRLYDIDIIIRKTLVYTALTLTLGLVYIGGILLGRALLAPLTGNSDLAIVASTLAIAALFNPLRKRIQQIIDKRFYRKKYDAAKVLAAFAATARDETDLARLTDEMLRVVDETVQPAVVGLWLREPGSDMQGRL